MAHKQIYYSDKYTDEHYEYRLVTLMFFLLHKIGILSRELIGTFTPPNHAWPVVTKFGGFSIHRPLKNENLE